MNINLEMLFDEFPAGEVRLVAQSESSSIDLSGLYLLNQEVSLEPDYLYVCTPATLTPFLSGRLPLTLAIAGDYDNAELRKHGHRALIFPGVEDPAILFNRLQGAKERFDRWDEDMLKAILSGKSTQTVLDIAALRLTNPIAMFDKEFGLVMTAGTIPANIAGSIWESVLEKSYSPPFVLTPGQGSDIAQRLRQSDWPFQYHSEFLNENHLCCSLFVAGVFFGTFGLSEFNPFTGGQIATLAWVTKRMEQSLEHNLGESGTTADMPYYILRILGGFDVEEPVIEFHLRQQKWKPSDWFQVLRIEPSVNSSLSPQECAAYRNPIRSILPESLVFQYENGLFVLVHSKAPLLPTRYGDLNREMERYDLRTGISMPFQDFMFIKAAFVQSQHALACGTGTLNYFRQNYTKSLLSALEQITDLDSFCHPGILSAWQHGDERDRQFFSSVQTYLANGRNLTDTAKKLNIHRNTLVYRIERVNEILGIDLYQDTVDGDLLHMLTTTLQIVTAREGTSPHLP